MLTILIVLLIIAILFGGFGYNQWGTRSLSPLGIVIVVILLLWAFGVLR